jgi:hypothetical protein
MNREPNGILKGVIDAGKTGSNTFSLLFGLIYLYFFLKKKTKNYSK